MKFVDCASRLTAGDHKWSKRRAGKPHSRLLALRQEVRSAVHLAEAEIGAGQDRLGALERVNVIGTRFLAQVEILHEEIAGTVELVDVLLGRVELVGFLLLDVFCAHQVGFEPRLLRFLLRDGLGVRGALGDAVRHELLVVLLRLSLVALGRRDLHLEVALQLVDERNRSARVLLRVRIHGLRRRRRGVLHAHLREDRHTRTGDAARRARGLGLRDAGVRAAGVHVDLLLGRERPLRGRHVEVRVVELVEAVLRNLEKLESGVVLRGRRHELLVLVLALSRPILHGLVCLLDALLQNRELVDERGDARFRLGDLGLEAADTALQVLLRVLRGVELGRAPLEVRVVVLLLLAELRDQLVDHLDDLLEADLLAAERHRDEREIRAALLHLLQGREGLGAEVLVAVRELEERRRGQGLLEEVERVVVVENLDGLRDGHELERPSLHTLFVLSRLRGAALLQLHEEDLICAELLLRVLQVILQVHDLHGGLSGALGLGLDRGSRGGNLLFLRRDETFVLRNRVVLDLRDAIQLSLHILLQLRQNPDDLLGDRDVLVATVRRQELRESITRVTRHGPCALENEVPQGRRSGALEEGAAEPFRQRCHRRLAACDVALELAALFSEGSGLLLTLLRRGLNRCLRVLAVCLVLLQLGVKLSLQALRLLDRRLELRDLGAQLRRAVRKLTVVLFAVADELFVQVLVPLTLLRDLRLHLLQQAHNPADRILERVSLKLQGSCVYSSQAEKSDNRALHCFAFALVSLEPK